MLDTHALIWFLTGDRRLSAVARAAIETPGADVFVSAVSAYEIEQKRALGKPMPFLPLDLMTALQRAGYRFLPISFQHAAAAGRLPMTHKDPWDRLLIAQSQLERLPIATSDPVFAAFGCEVVW
ncbi:MAG: type II toxin-antitoxin system VapC family toxin [Terricaulis sp.]